MAPPTKPPVTEKQLQGFRYLEQFGSLFERLHACGLDKAGNRDFFYDQYACLLLLYFFTPTLTSMRGLQQITGLAKVQQFVGCKTVSRTSLSEAAYAFDPDLLRPIVAELAQQALPVVSGPEAEALRGLTAVDGSILPALPKMVWALWMDETHRGAKMHVHFDVLKGVPEDATVTPAACSEIEQLTATLKEDRLYVVDRGYACYALFRAILDRDSSFIGRVKECTAFTVQEERELSAAARAAGVIRDVVVKRLGTEHHKDEVRQEVRLVWVQTGKMRPDGQPEILLLCTNRLELAAELVALGYRYRWWVELFFRWLKCILGCRHLIANNLAGVTIQVYMALIASLMISLWTNTKPSKRTFEMFCHYFAGWATFEELCAHVQNLHKKKDNPSKEPNSS